jgi:hypothetical protein
MPTSPPARARRHLQEVIARCVAVMPTHADFIAGNCAASGLGA